MPHTDSSSEEDNLDLLREAADTHFLKDSLFKSNSSETKEEQEENITVKRPSLRQQLNKEEHCNPFKVTPEFQSFIAKQLGKIIDRQLIKFSEHSSTTKTEDESINGTSGVRLLGNSSTYLSAEAPQVNEIRKRKRYIPQHDGTGDDMEKCKTIAVTSEWITCGDAVSGWEKSTRGELVIVNKQGDIIEHKRKKNKIKTNSWGVRDDSFHINIGTSVKCPDEKKQKRKEKNKKRREKLKLKKQNNDTANHLV
ncbi:hypothetical protein C0J52_04189 [Blattella germanica]|nr:hypothetical protein C0J52_04189 [Blattella germanica]